MRLALPKLWLIPTVLAVVTACTPPGLQYRQLAPVPDPNTLTLDNLVRAMDSTGQVKPDPSSHLTVVVNTDSAIGTLTVFEYDDIIALQVYLYNNSSQPFGMDPSGLVLMDGNRTAFRQLATHEAANLYASRVQGIPPYQPKYTYEFSSNTYGTAQVYGNTAHYSSQTAGSVRAVEDPYNALGYSIGAAIAQSYNRKYQGMASTIYSLGVGQHSSVSSKSGGYGAVYWLKRKDWRPPLILRFAESGYEVRFNQIR
jgi:hypothetical protein